MPDLCSTLPFCPCESSLTVILNRKEINVTRNQCYLETRHRYWDRCSKSIAKPKAPLPKAPLVERFHTCRKLIFGVLPSFSQRTPGGPPNPLSIHRLQSGSNRDVPSRPAGYPAGPLSESGLSFPVLLPVIPPTRRSHSERDGASDPSPDRTVRRSLPWQALFSGYHTCPL